MLETRNFLVPDATFAIEMLAFVVVLFVMTRYVVPRIRAAMQERQQAITDALTAAREAQARQRVADAQAAEIRAAARREASAMTEQARSMRDSLIAQGKHAGIEEYRWLAGRADREMKRRAELASAQTLHQARIAAVEAAVAYLGSDVDVTRIRQLVDEHFDSRATDSGIAA